MPTFQAPRGLFDILPNPLNEPWRSSHLWEYVEGVIRQTANQYGYREIRTPIFERTELFERGVGESSDIVSKEMYSFQDKGGRSMTLRPEGTAPAIRAFLEHHLQQGAATQKFFYIGPMFRYERSQAGRYRQHHQFGAEAVGNGSPEQDVELIDLLHTLYRRLGLRQITLHVNSLGDAECRKRFREALTSYLNNAVEQLSPDSRARLRVNPLRILDSKEACDREVLEGAPSILDHLSSESQDHFAAVLRLLDQLGISYQVNPRCVRGLDYYSRTVFEFTAAELGAQNSIGGGGRYDGLIRDLGGPHLPGMGFGAGIERIIQTMIGQQSHLPPSFAPLLYLIPIGDRAKERCYGLLHRLRQEGISAEMDFSDRKLGKIMRHADQIGAEFVCVIGSEELDSEEVVFKEMATGQEFSVPLNLLGRLLRLKLASPQMAAFLDEMNTPFEHPLEAEFFLKQIEKTVGQTRGLAKRLEEIVGKMKELLQ